MTGPFSLSPRSSTSSEGTRIANGRVMGMSGSRGFGRSHSTGPRGSACRTAIGLGPSTCSRVNAKRDGPGSWRLTFTSLASRLHEMYTSLFLGGTQSRHVLDRAPSGDPTANRNTCSPGRLMTRLRRSRRLAPQPSAASRSSRCDWVSRTLRT